MVTPAAIHQGSFVFRGVLILLRRTPQVCHAGNRPSLGKRALLPALRSSDWLASGFIFVSVNRNSSNGAFAVYLSLA